VVLLSEQVDLDASLTDSEADALESQMGSSKVSPINLFNDQLDSYKFLGTGLYYEFRTALSQLVFDGQVEGRFGSYSNAKTPFPLASASKLFTAFAAMYTMELKPKDWYPKKYIHKFKGWEEFKNFPVHGTRKKANLQIHHLLTHTSGLPFGMRMSKRDLARQTLFYWPGTAFGYTLGHRVLGWMLRDYWQAQPEARYANLITVQDTFKWLIFDKLGLSPETMFDDEMTDLFGYSGQAGDASIQSTGEDLMKLAVVALRRGKLPNGTQLISERNWNQWAVPNLLPQGKLTEDLVAWQSGGSSWLNWNVGGIKAKIMKQSGAYGWNYFGATYNRSEDIGWCGFFSSCLRVTYANNLAFVIMQRDVADLKKSKPFIVRYFDRMAESLRCTQKGCMRKGGAKVFCETSGKDLTWSARCPSNTTRGKAWHRDTKVDPRHHACYAPSCHR